MLSHQIRTKLLSIIRGLNSVGSKERSIFFHLLMILLNPVHLVLLKKKKEPVSLSPIVSLTLHFAHSVLFWGPNYLKQHQLQPGKGTSQSQVFSLLAEIQKADCVNALVMLRTTFSCCCFSLHQTL